MQEQVYLSDGQRHVWIDLSARRGENENLILIEIKGFETTSQVDVLMAAVGQYAFYRAMLQYLEMSLPLYLAIPRPAYEGVFQSPAAQQVIRNLNMWLLVFEPTTEEIVEWVR